MFPLIDKEQTGRRLKELMRICQKTPRDIQEYLCLSCVQTVYRWTEGVNLPSLDNLYALSRLFQVDMDDMVAGDGRTVYGRPGLSRLERLAMYCARWQAARQEIF